jgi:hypothetical protein
MSKATYLEVLKKSVIEKETLSRTRNKESLYRGSGVSQLGRLSESSDAVTD